MIPSSFLDNGISIQQRIFLCAGRRIGGLGAEPAIFRAAAALPVDDGTEVEAVLAEMELDLAGGGAELLQGSLIKGQGFLPGDHAAV